MIGIVSAKDIGKKFLTYNLQVGWPTPAPPTRTLLVIRVVLLHTDYRARGGKIFWRQCMYVQHVINIRYFSLCHFSPSIYVERCNLQSYTALERFVSESFNRIRLARKF